MKSWNASSDWNLHDSTHQQNSIQNPRKLLYRIFRLPDFEVSGQCRNWAISETQQRTYLADKTQEMFVDVPDPQRQKRTMYLLEYIQNLAAGITQVNES